MYLKIIIFILITIVLSACNSNTEKYPLSAIVYEDTLSLSLATSLKEMPLKCIFQEYPNKTGHTASSQQDILQTPAQLHPSFYGCFDWHSSVHGHWMLVRILNKFPDIEGADAMKQTLSKSITKANIDIETAYFDNNVLGKIFERTYGWAWLLKLDQELHASTDSSIRLLGKNLQPLTQKVLQLWREYLPKQSYPNKTGVHGNTAFALSLAYDWALANQDDSFKNQITQKAKDFYQNIQNYPAHLEPDGADFFSPSLYVADLMTRILPPNEYNQWFTHFFTEEGLEQVCAIPHVSDRNDYQIVHLDGLMFSKVTNLRRIIPVLNDDALKEKLLKAQAALIKTGLQNLSASNYGGEHWLASFAILSLSGY